MDMVMNLIQVIILHINENNTLELIMLLFNKAVG